MINVCPLSELAQFRDAVQMQRVIWGWDELDLLPVRFFVVAHSVGGQVLGAFHGDMLCGFLLAIPGVKDQCAYLHSHMLGVLSEYRNTGAGLALKLAQKEDALSRGITRVEWSFDPLNLKNAYFNLEKLGAIVREFKPNLYGHTTSTLQAGLPTDRCIAEWDLQNQRPRLTPIERVSVPNNIDQLKRANPDAARAIQSEVAQQLQRHLGAGLAITGFQRTAEYGTYLLSPWPSK